MTVEKAAGGLMTTISAVTQTPFQRRVVLIGCGLMLLTALTGASDRTALLEDAWPVPLAQLLGAIGASRSTVA